MSWEDPSTDMAHCHWCSWDLYKDQAIDGMHLDCAIKAERREKLRRLIKPILLEQGIDRPDENHLLRDICRLIEKRLDEKEQD